MFWHISESINRDLMISNNAKSKRAVEEFLDKIEFYDETNFNQQKWHYLNANYIKSKEKYITIRKKINKHCILNMIGFLLTMYEYDVFSKVLIVDNLDPVSGEAIEYYYSWSKVAKRYNIFNWLPGLLTGGYTMSKNFITLKKSSKNKYVNLNIKYNKPVIYNLGETPDLVLLNSAIFFDNLVVNEAVRMNIPCIKIMSGDSNPGNSNFRIYDNNLSIINYTKYVLLLKRVMLVGKSIGLKPFNKKWVDSNGKRLQKNENFHRDFIENITLSKIMALRNVVLVEKTKKTKDVNKKAKLELIFRRISGTVLKKKSTRYRAEPWITLHRLKSYFVKIKRKKKKTLKRLIKNIRRIIKTKVDLREEKIRLKKKNLTREKVEVLHEIKYKSRHIRNVMKKFFCHIILICLLYG
jgi:hypothetical protein